MRYLDANEETCSQGKASSSGSGKRKRILKSKWWQYFEMLPKVEGEDLRCKCKACGITYKAESSMGTGNLRRHILNQCPRQKASDIAQALLEQAHFIDSNWVLQKRIINFSYMPPPHSGIALCDKINSLFNVWGIQRKVFTITLDNAAANDVFVGLLRDQLGLNCSLVSGGEFLHVRCCAHILNLIMQDGLKRIDSSVDKIRECVKYVKGSQVRKQKFIESVTQTSLDSKKSLRQDWGQFEKICKFLEVFYETTTLFSGVKYPTSNLYFPRVFIVQLTISQALQNSDDFMRSMANRMFQKFDKYWKDYNILFVIAVIVDPRFKMQFVEFCYNKLYGHGSNELSLVRSKLVSLFEEYMHLDIASQLSTSGASSSSHSGIDDNASLALNLGSGCMDVLKEFDTFQSLEFIGRAQKSQLELYLEEPTIDRITKLDVLGFWKAHQFSVMKPDVVEALVCCRDWLVGEKGVHGWSRLDQEILIWDVIPFSIIMVRASP
ncbi:hypothetical protein ZIOFF_018053 [Zingiber officinale]|uniref:BED-type domain-containing protein n=1 Tax=Zingiber officinale TaxID=94328 RepID=A0A8J5HFZ2_ZINOF|nr:hypothetical protein ZIOFF_018053 [Zingiber officinale]